jgi:hypothetical protein
MAASDAVTGLALRGLGAARTVSDLTIGTARGVAAIPRLVAALETLAEHVEDLRRLADAVPSLDRLGEGIAPIARLSDGVDAVRRVADALPTVEGFVERLGESVDLGGLTRALDSLLATTAALQPLADAVHELNAAVATLNNTVSPLQGTAERLGRFVDRLPASRRRASEIASPFVVPES